MKIQNSIFGFAIVLGLFLAPSVSVAKVDIGTTAVVLVDMQAGFYERGGVTDTPGLLSLVTKQMELLNWAVAKNIPVLIFEYDGFGATDPRLTGILKGHETKSMTKFFDNGFTDPSGKPAVAYLKSLKIKTLIMAGINGAYCVHDTTIGAISSGFDVVTASDIVGNLNQNPPIYPNNTWYFKDNKLEIFPNLNAILY